VSDKGYIHLDRDALGHEFFRRDSHSEFEAWVWLLSEAAWRSRQRRVGEFFVQLQRGELVASIRFLMKEWSWSQGKVDRFFSRLKDEGMIATHADTGITVITICKYSEYQGEVIEADTDSDTPVDTRSDTRADHPRIQTRTTPGYKTKTLNHSNIESLKQESAGALFPEPPAQPKPKKKPTGIARTWPDDFAVTAEHIAFATARGFALPAISTMFERFKNHHQAKGSRFVDWSAAWRTWVGNQVQFNADRNAPRAPDSTRSPLL
jgi:hypothetical protein